MVFQYGCKIKIALKKLPPINSTFRFSVLKNLKLDTDSYFTDEKDVFFESLSMVHQ